MGTVVKSYCLECEWEISGTDYTADERTAAMIDHAVDTGHDVDSITRAEGANSDESEAVF